MKQIVIIFSLFAIVGCSKSQSAGGGGSTTCICTYIYKPGRDTTVKFAMNAGGATTVDSQCRYQQTILISQYGKNSASCNLQ